MIICPTNSSCSENMRNEITDKSNRNKILEYRWEILRKKFLTQRFWQASSSGIRITRFLPHIFLYLDIYCK